MTNILIALVALLVIVALVQLTRVSELLAELKNQDVNEVTDDDNKTQGVLFLIIGMGFIAFVVARSSFCSWTENRCFDEIFYDTYLDCFLYCYSNAFLFCI